MVFINIVILSVFLRHTHKSVEHILSRKFEDFFGSHRTSIARWLKCNVLHYYITLKNTTIERLVVDKVWGQHDWVKCNELKCNCNALEYIRLHYITTLHCIHYIKRLVVDKVWGQQDWVKCKGFKCNVLHYYIILKCTTLLH